MVVVFTLFSCNSSKESDWTAFTQQVEQIRHDYDNVGLVVSIVRDNKQCYSQGFGELTQESLVRIASISKTFVGEAVMQQVNAGRLSLSDDVSELLGFSVRNPYFADIVITLENLLSHTSSINDYFGRLDDINPQLNADYSKAYNNYAPGHGYCYCDFNITLAANILERVTGERMDDYIRAHLLRPIGVDGDFNFDSLENARIAKLYFVEPPEDVDSVSAVVPIVRESVNAYRSPSESLLNYRYDANVFSPGSGMKISADGLTTWMLFLMNDSVTKEMMRPRYPSYHNYGITLLHSSDYSPNVSLVGHKGGAYGLRSAFYFNPYKKYGFVVISSGALNAPVRHNGEFEIDKEILCILSSPQANKTKEDKINIGIIKKIFKNFFIAF